MSVRIHLSAAVFLAAVFNASAQDERPRPPAATPQDFPFGRETLKSRLSDKASDQQRLDDCGVPAEKRGPKPRPIECAPKASQTGAASPQR